MNNAPFQIAVQGQSGEDSFKAECSDYFPGLIQEILHFFETGISSVRPVETLEIMTLIEAVRRALEQQDQCINVKRS